jgi:hypothetical protein
MKNNLTFQLAITGLTLSLATLSYKVLPATATTLTPAESSNSPEVMTLANPQQPSQNLSQYFNQLAKTCNQNSSSPGSSSNPTPVSTPEPSTIGGLALMTLLGLHLLKNQKKLKSY